MPQKAHPHEKLDIKTKIVVATGLGGEGRFYPDYDVKYGKENVIVVCWDKNCTDLDTHLRKLKTYIPKDEPFVATGHSMGGSIWLELMNRENLPNQKGLVLVGCSRKVRASQGVDFIMKFPWIFLWVVTITLTLIAPIMWMVWRKKTFDTYRELWRFLSKDGAKKIHRQYNRTLKKLGTVENVKNPNVPLLVVKLRKDTLVDEDDLEFTKSMFKNVREQIIEVNSLHLTEKFDYITVEKIALEAEYLGLMPKKTKSS